MVRLRIYRISYRLAERLSRFLTMATSTAIHICDLTAFSLVPKNALMRRCCLIHYLLLG
jgi:hypothetical protein